MATVAEIRRDALIERIESLRSEVRDAAGNSVSYDLNSAVHALEVLDREATTAAGLTSDPLRRMAVVRVGTGL